MADLRLLLELLHDQDRLLVTPIGRPRRLRAQLVVDVELGPLAVAEQDALDVELGGPGEAALMLRIAVGHVLAGVAQLLEEGRELVELLPGRFRRELHPVAIFLLEVLAVLLEQVLPVEGAGDRAVVREGDQPLARVHRAAGIQEVLEPDLLAVAFGVLRQRVVAGEVQQVGIEVGEWGADRLVLDIVEVKIGLAAAQVDADLLLHDRQVVGQDLDLDAGEIVEWLQVLADREGGRRVLAHEHELGAAVLLPLGVVGRGRVGRPASDDGVQADRDRAHAERRRGTTAELEKAAPVDPTIDGIPRDVKHPWPP